MSVGGDYAAFTCGIGMIINTSFLWNWTWIYPLKSYLLGNL